jgi:hypothetical protein
MLNEGNQTHNCISSSGSGTVINYGSGSDFLTSYGSGSTSQKVTVPTVPVPQRRIKGRYSFPQFLSSKSQMTCYLRNSYSSTGKYVSVEDSKTESYV